MAKNIVDHVNDIYGKEVYIEGVGTHYDEAKNSIAIGKDTVALGQDQFVFGRNNAEDATKVEVVGGGGIPTSPIEVGEVLYVGQVTEVNSLKVIYGGETTEDLINALSKHFTNADKISIEVDQSLGLSILYYVITTRINSGSGLRSEILGVTSTSNKTYLAPDRFISTDSAASIEQINTLVPSIKLLSEDPSYVTEYKLERVYDASSLWYVNRYYNIFNIYENRAVATKNIRTLDWDGNEMLAGDLEVKDCVNFGSTQLSSALLSRIITSLGLEDIVSTSQQDWETAEAAPARSTIGCIPNIKVAVSGNEKAYCYARLAITDGFKNKLQKFMRGAWWSQERLGMNGLWAEDVEVYSPDWKYKTIDGVYVSGLPFETNYLWIRMPVVVTNCSSFRAFISGTPTLSVGDSVYEIYSYSGIYNSLIKKYRTLEIGYFKPATITQYDILFPDSFERLMEVCESSIA